MKNVPKIRFKGFTDAWEQRKFKYLYIKSNLKNDLTFTEKHIISVASMYFKNDAKISSLDYLRTYNIFKIGDIAFEGHTNKDFLYGRFVENTIGDGIVSHVFDVFRPIAEYDLIYWKYSINNEYIMSKILRRCTKSSRMMTNIVTNDFLDESIRVPTIKEQNKIGLFLQKVDSLITLHQRKCEQLKTLKKFLLQKIFPENGNEKPELRFAGFTDAWEQRRLNNYLDVSNQKNINNIFLREDVLSVSGEYGIINQIKFHGRSFAGDSLEKYGVVNKGDVVYTKSPLKSNPYGIIRVNKGDAGIVSTLYAVYSVKSNTYASFIQEYFQLDSRLNKYLHPLVNKGAKNDMKISSANALKGLVIFPSTREQVKISYFLTKLDNLITLHQRKYEELKKVKQYLLQNMFPQE